MRLSVFVTSHCLYFSRNVLSVSYCWQVGTVHTLTLHLYHSPPMDVIHRAMDAFSIEPVIALQKVV